MRARVIVLFMLSTLVLSIPISAKEIRIEEVFAGYSFLHGDIQKKASGWEFSAGKNVTQWFGLHADFDAHHQSALGSVRHEHDILFGPQFSHRTDQFTLFAHSLGGMSHVSGTRSDTGFSYIAGGGLDWDHFNLSIRLIQVDFHSANLFGQFQHEARFSTGIVFHLVGFVDPARPIPQPPPDNPPSEQKPRSQPGSLAYHLCNRVMHIFF